MPSPRVMSPRKGKPGTPSLESSEAIGARLDELERKMERLRALYESFFLGAERRPPHVPRQELNRLVLETQQVSIRNAALRFRFQAVSQRWTLLTTYWNRTLREIESGTYRRDLQRAYRRIAARGEPLTETEAAALGIPAGRAQAFVAQQNRRWGGGTPADPAAPSQSGMVTPADRTSGAAITATDAPVIASPGTAALTPGSPTHATPMVARPTNAPPKTAAPASASSAPASPASPPSSTGSPRTLPGAAVDLTALHRAYTEAHARLALPGRPPSEDRMRAQVLPQLEKLHAANPGARLDVAIVSENGRVVIRARPSR